MSGATTTRRLLRPRQAPIKRPHDYDEFAHGGKLIWVYCAVSSAIDAEILWRMCLKEKCKARSTALAMGYSRLREKAGESVRMARAEGQLLLCWEGTTVLEVPA